jgi:hypothetical protein
MTLHISQRNHASKEHLRAYHVGKSIILPHIRYIDNGNRQGTLFHSQVISSGGHCRTLGCDRMDVSGLCAGHKMSRKDFLDRYCGAHPDRHPENEEEI